MRRFIGEGETGHAMKARVVLLRSANQMEAAPRRVLQQRRNEPCALSWLAVTAVCAFAASAPTMGCLPKAGAQGRFEAGGRRQRREDRAPPPSTSDRHERLL